MMVRRNDSGKPERRDVARTRKAIEEAYHSLLFKKPYEKITVTDVINEANISRGTFYAYHRDISDLAGYMEDKVLSSLKKVVSEATIDRIMEDPKVVVEFIVRDLVNHREELEMMLKKTGGTSLIDKIKRMLRTAIFDEGELKQNPALEIINSGVIGLIVDSCVDWILREDPCESDILIDSISTFIAGGAASIRQKD